jgi:hypothetical protein
LWLRHGSENTSHIIGVHIYIYVVDHVNNIVYTLSARRGKLPILDGAVPSSGILDSQLKGAPMNTADLPMKQSGLSINLALDHPLIETPIYEQFIRKPCFYRLRACI